MQKKYFFFLTYPFHLFYIMKYTIFFGLVVLIACTNSNASSGDSIGPQIETITIDKDKGEEYQSEGFTVKIPKGWVMSNDDPWKDADGRPMLDAMFATESWDNESGTFGVSRRGFDMDITFSKLDILNGIKDDEENQNVRKSYEGTVSLNGVEYTKIVVDFSFDEVDFRRISYLANTDGTGTVLEFEYALEDEERYTAPFATFLQTFESIPLKQCTY